MSTDNSVQYDFYVYYESKFYIHQTTFTYTTYVAQVSFDAFTIKKVWLETEEAKKKIIDAGGKIGKMNIALSWYDPNDLDLIVIDPTYGEKIYFKNKVCTRCGAELDVDMNYDGLYNAYTPVEHIYYNSVEKGKRY